MSLLNEKSVLVLNAIYQIIGISTPRQVLIALNSGFAEDDIAAKAIDVVYKRKENGELDFNTLEYWMPLTFEEWTLTEARGNIDKTIHTPKLSFRCPTVIVAVNFDKMPMRRFKVSKGALYERQGRRCGYTNEEIPMNKGNIEHIIPKSKGGKDNWENLIFVKAEINSKRGNKELSECGLHPLFKHKEPKPIPAHHTIKKCIHPDWQWFVNNN